MFDRDAITSDAPAAAPDRQPSAADRIVDAWFIETFHNRPIDPTEINRLIEARDRLKERLRATED